MTDRKSMDPSVLDNESLQILGSSLQPFPLSDQQKGLIHARLMSRIAQDESASTEALQTVRSEKGIWVDLTPKIKKKQLFIDREKGTETYLLKALPGAVLPPHRHKQDEFSLMLEGDLTIGDTHLQAGDFHIAHKGSKHGWVRTEKGCVVYMQGQILS